jgi:hypothetical protein
MQAFASIVRAPRWVAQSLSSTARRAFVPLALLATLTLAGAGGPASAMPASSLGGSHAAIARVVPQVECGGILLPC